MQIADPSFRAVASPAFSPPVRTQPAVRSTATDPLDHVVLGRSAERQAALRVIVAEVLQALGGKVGAMQHGHPVRAHGYGPADAVGFGVVAHALRATLANSTPDRADPVAALLGQVDAGVDAAQAELTQLGFESADIASAIGEFRRRTGGLVGALAETPPDSGVSATAVSAERVRKEQGVLELLTQDGDVVRIRFRSRDAERVSVAALESGDAAVMSVHVQTFSGSRIKVDVQGELDAGELDAIRGFLGEVDKVASEFFAGDAEAAFAAGAALQFDSEEIARYALKLSFSERVEMRALQRAMTPLPGSAPAPVSTATAPSAAAVPPVPSVSNRAPANASFVTPAAEASTQPATVPNAQSNDNTAPSTSPLETIRTFLQRVLQLADTPLSAGRLEVSLSFKLRFVMHAIEAAQPVTEPSTGSTAARDVLAETANLADVAQPAETPAA